MTELPTSKATFLYTDIEGSTRLWEQHPQAMQPALARHDDIIRQAIVEHHGQIFNTAGDAFSAAFAVAADALAAALAAQRQLLATNWGDGIVIKVRMVLHSGEAIIHNHNYVGLAVNRTTQLLGAAHGAQMLISQATATLIQDCLPEGVSLRDMGEHRLKDLTGNEHIYQLVAADLPAEFPPLNTLDARRNNLPTQPNPLVGREADISQLLALLRRPTIRLVTLTGPGGTGKTRLSLAAAAELLNDFDEVSFVALATVNEAALVIPTIAQALGLKEEAGRSLFDALRDYIGTRKLLLVLDNFEQVIAAAREVDALLTTAIGLKLLVSSREVLHLYGEQEYPVPPLAAPDPDHLPSVAEITAYPAVALFVARAQAAKRDFVLTAENTPAIVKICARLDGLPLAIELAAARVKLFSPNQIASQIAQRLSLFAAAHELPPRQRSLRGAIDWSYDLLNHAERTLFASLSTFVAGFTIEAAEQVCAESSEDILDLLSSLVDKSLLRQQIDADDTPRFLMLETIREYAAEQLAVSGGTADLRRRHAAYFAQLVEQAETEMVGKQQASWLARLEQEHDNIRAALAWYLECSDGEAAMALGGAIWRFWYAHGYLSEGRRWLEAALLTAPKVLNTTSAKAFNAAGNLAYVQGDYTAAHQHLSRSLDIRRHLADERGIATSLSNLGLVATSLGNYQQAQQLYEESLAIRQRLGDQRPVAQVLNNLGLLAVEREDYVTAQPLFSRGLTISRELGDSQAIANALHNLGEVAYFQSDYALANQLCSESLAMYRTLGSKQGIAYSLHILATTALQQGDHATARRLLAESLPLIQEMGDTRIISTTLTQAAAIALKSAQTTAAAQLLGAAATLRAQVTTRTSSTYLLQHQQTLEATKAQSLEADFAQYYHLGEQMNATAACEYAIAYLQS